MKVQAAAQSSSSRDSTLSTIEGPAGSGFEKGTSVLPLTANGSTVLLSAANTLGQSQGQTVVVNGTHRQNGYPIPIPEGGSYRQTSTVVRSRTSPSLS
jgi:hypothetical protein